MTHLDTDGLHTDGNEAKQLSPVTSTSQLPDVIHELAAEVPAAVPSEVIPQPALDTSSRADLRSAYLRRYAVLKSPLPSGFSTEDPLQARLASGTTRCCVVEIGPALSPTLNDKSQSFDGAPWVDVWFDEPDADGAVEELLPIESLDFLDEWATSVPGAASMQFSGQMAALPPQLPLDERRSVVMGSEQVTISDSDPEAE